MNNDHPYARLSILALTGGLAAFSWWQSQQSDVEDRARALGFDEVLLVADFDGEGPPNAVVRSEDGILLLRDASLREDAPSEDDVFLPVDADSDEVIAELVDDNDIDDLVITRVHARRNQVDIRIYLNPLSPDRDGGDAPDIEHTTDLETFDQLDLSSLLQAPTPTVARAPKPRTPARSRTSGITESNPAPEPTLAPAAAAPKVAAAPTPPVGLSSYPPSPGLAPTPGDADGDGITVAQGDCDDADATIRPGVWEYGYDGVDSDCGGSDATDIDDDFSVSWKGALMGAAGYVQAPGRRYRRRWTRRPPDLGRGGRHPAARLLQSSPACMAAAVFPTRKRHGPL